ncbi:Ppx/GppA family phosphatase [Alterinioella nitratireducens]|uniref:Ppx/GppA family phosphatase n=1 Tax=Alterinioella nitratireducens TaxID=2735915 RepID=UPI00405A46DA
MDRSDAMPTQTRDTLPPGQGLFSRPLFQDPTARALARVGVIDIGSNSVRLVVFDGAARSPAYFYNEKVLCGLGAGFAETGRLSAEGRPRAMAALKRFAALASGMNVSALIAVATAAVREAEDGPEFRAEAEAETGLTIHVVDGEEEARLSAQGVLLGWPGAEGMICDIGGSSMELAELKGNGDIGTCRSSDLGPLKLQGIKGGKKAVKAHIKDTIAGLQKEFPERPERLFLVGGSWRAIARIDMERRGYPLKVLHEYRMSRKDIRDTIKYIDAADLDELRDRTGTSAERMRLVPLAALVLKELVNRVKPDEVAVSSYGIREGMLYEQMSDEQRNRDPLIEAAYMMESLNARMPGFGRALFKFIEPLFGSVRPARKRVMRAACLLHDVSWRAHPDYRAEVCFDNATRANLGALKHGERVYLGLALLHRYKSSRKGTNFEPLMTLLAEKDQREAEILGRAMRFGAMFTLERPQDHGALKLYPKKGILQLTLRSKMGRDLFSEVAQARFEALAQAIGADPVVKHKQR